jgi:hypothetical protein
MEQNNAYQQARQSVFATATIPDGYFGDRKTVGLAIVDNTVMCVSDNGFFRAGIDARTPEEALYLLKNHPLHFRHLEIELQN